MLKVSARKSRISFLAICLVLLVMNVFSSSAQDTPEPTAIVADLGTGSIHISFWNGLTGSDGVTLNEMLAQFVVEHPEISVTTEIIPWGTLYTKLQAAFVADEAPDMFLVHASEVAQFASYGVVQDLSSWYDTGGGTLPSADFAQPGFGGMFIDGIPYGIPLDNHGRGVWINVDHFTAAGLDPNVYPNNYEETVAMLQALTIDANGNNAASPDFDATNVVQWGTTMEWIYTDFLSYLWGNGGDILSEDGTTATINSEAGASALQRMYDLIYVYHVAPQPAGFDSWAAYAAGTLSVLPTGTWFRNFAEVQTDITGQAWPILPIGDTRAAWFGAHTFMVPTSTEGEQLAAVRTLVEWVSENQVSWAASGQVPARISAQAALDPVNYPSNILIGSTFQEYGHMEPACQVILELQAAIDPELNAALNDLKPVQQALDDAAERMQQVLDRTPC
jgi:ABC-type glycerol-3-phosphate transport system substrate-binding protein